MIFRLDDLLARFDISLNRDTSHECSLLYRVPAVAIQLDMDVGELVERGNLHSTSKSDAGVPYADVEIAVRRRRGKWLSDLDPNIHCQEESNQNNDESETTSPPVR